jgi:hypothetical protein
MLKNFLLPLAGMLLLAAAPVLAQSVSVEIADDGGYTFPTYPADSHNGTWRAYVQAERDVRYGIRIRNNTGRRLGLVIAVDGRNIISGEKSHLRNTERMYILAPYAEETYNGWRTSRDEIHRFYFTSEGDSYAEAWGDGSAMGVIAVAVYAEREQDIRRERRRMGDYPVRAPLNSMAAESADEAAGTGFGELEHSSSRLVEFQPEPSPLERHFYKYEWRESLCRKNIISCRPERRERENRMWDDDDGYAPYPPERRYP